MYNSMDLLAEAINDRLNGSCEKFYFVGEDGEKREHNIQRYYIKPFPATKLEKKLFSLSKGKILDVGSATGNYFSELTKHGNVIGLETCNALVKIAQNRDVNNIKCVDIFDYNTKDKFDTITLLENNIGLGGNVDKTKILIQKLISLLNTNGKILIMLSRRAKKDFVIAKIAGFYKGKTGKQVNWLNITPDYLKQICAENECKLKIIAKDDSNYLIEIKPKM